MSVLLLRGGQGRTDASIAGELFGLLGLLIGSCLALIGWRIRGLADPGAG